MGMESEMKTIVYLMLVLMFFGLMWLNTYEYRRRAKMTPEEREREDEEIRREMQIW